MDMTELLAQRAQIDAQIAAARQESIAGILEQMAQLGLTVADLAPAQAAGAKRAVKYRDGNGNTWTGVGQRPRWLREAVLAGATLEQFSVRA